MELKSNELRIGNILRYKNNVLLEIDCDEIGEIYYYSKSYKPVPLIEQYFIQAGFDVVGNNYYYNGLCIFKDNGSFYYGLRDEGMMDLHIEYLHQLQNLYFTLKKEELIFKL